MFEQNNVGVRVANPVIEYYHQLDRADPKYSEFAQVVEVIASNMDDGDDSIQSCIFNSFLICYCQNGKIVTMICVV